MKIAADVESTVETITPDIARELLATTDVNRKLRVKHVKWISEQIKAGEYHLNGQSIVVDWDGKLIDGQHRLSAVLEAGIPITTVVIRGVDPKSFMNIDSGVKRSVADALYCAGEEYTHNLAAALSFLHSWKARQMLSVGKSNPDGYNSEEALALLKANPGLRECARWFMDFRTKSLIGKAVIPCPTIALRHIFNQYDTKTADLFFRMLDGEVSPTQTIRVLKTWLARNSEKMNRTEYSAIMVKAFSAFADKTDLKKLSWCRYGDGTEDFPVFCNESFTRGKAFKKGINAKKAAAKKIADSIE